MLGKAGAITSLIKVEEGIADALEAIRAERDSIAVNIKITV